MYFSDYIDYFCSIIQISKFDPGGMGWGAAPQKVGKFPTV